MRREAPLDILHLAAHCCNVPVTFTLGINETVRFELSGATETISDGAGRRHSMKQQIARFSPHQNGKVFAILMAISALVFVVPFMLIAFASAPEGARPSVLFFLAMPVIYLVMGYVMVAIGCAVYNVLFKHIGGVEFEARSLDA